MEGDINFQIIILIVIVLFIQPVISSTENIDGLTSIIADIAPLAQLVGEKAVKQFLGSVSGIQFYGLLAFSPIGVVSILVTAIRISRVRSLLGLIGRSEETELELVNDVLQCTTGDHGYGAVETGDLELTRTQQDWCKAIVPIRYDSPIINEYRQTTQVITGIATPGYVWLEFNAPEAGMIARPSISWIRTGLSAFFTMMLVATQGAMCFIRAREGDYWWSIVSGFSMCLAIWVICWATDAVTDDVEISKFSWGGWIFSHHLSYSVPMTTFLASRYAPELAPKRVRVAALSAAVILISCYVMNYLGLRQLPWGYSLAYVGIGVVGAVIRQMLLGMGEEVKLKQNSLTEILVNIAAQCWSVDDKAKLERNFSDKSLPLRHYNQDVGVITAKAAKRICTQVISSRVQMREDMVMVGHGTLLTATNGRQCLVVVTESCGEADASFLSRLAMEEGTEIKPVNDAILQLLVRADEIANMYIKAMDGDELSKERLIDRNNHPYKNIIEIGTYYSDFESAIESFSVSVRS
jgi:hypothetical protein